MNVSQSHETRACSSDCRGICTGQSLPHQGSAVEKSSGLQFSEVPGNPSQEELMLRGPQSTTLVPPEFRTLCSSILAVCLEGSEKR